MPTVEPVLTVKSLAELAWLVSRTGRQAIETRAEPSPEAVRVFWQSTRQLQRSWDQVLEEETLESAVGRSRFEETAAQLFTTELVARVWATILASIDQQTGRQDLTRIATNAVHGLLQIRNRLLSSLLAQSPSPWTADLDRLRRRCDRWTDLLIGNLCGANELFQFAFDSDRAKDFAEEACESASATRPVELLVAAGMRLSFLGQLPDVALDSPAFEQLMQAIMGSLPEQAFQRDGSLRSAPLSIESENANATEDVLLPGLNLSQLRRRYS